MNTLPPLHLIPPFFGARLAGIGAVWVAALLLAGNAHAQQTTVWEGDVSSDFMDGNNWEGGQRPPVCPIFCNNIVINNDIPVLLQADTGVPFFSPNLLLGGTAADSRLSIVGDGALITRGIVNLGGTATGSGTLRIADGGLLTATAILETGNIFRIGDLGTGTLTLANGGQLLADSGRLVLAFGAGATGRINIGAAAGEAATGAGLLQAGNIWFGDGDGRVVFNHTDSHYQFGVEFQSGNAGADAAVDFLSGTTVLTRNSTRFLGTATVRGGARLVAGDIAFGYFNSGDPGDPGNNSARLVVEDGIFSTSNDMSNGRPWTETVIHGDLLFGADSVIEMGLGVPSTDEGDLVGGDVIDVRGTLRLDGTLNIADLGGFTFGRYELFRYDGFDAGSNLDIIGSLPGGLNGSLSNDISNQRILLVVAQALGSEAYWVGGDGIWDTTTENWSDEGGGFFSAWNDGTAIFRGAGGTVRVTEDVAFSELAFESDVGGGAYRVLGDGGRLMATPVDEDEVVVNLSALAGVTGEVSAAIIGARPDVRLRKYNNGTVALSHDGNDWQGGTVIEGGTLQIGNGGTGGHLPGNVVNGATLAFNRADSYTYGGVVSGTGQLRQVGTGTTVLTGANSYTGQTVITAGTLQVGNGGSAGQLGSGAVNIGAGGTLAFVRDGDYTVTNAITGGGVLAQRGGGLLGLQGNLGNFSGTVRAELGRIHINGLFGGSADVLDALEVNGTLAGTATVRDGGLLSGTGSLGGLTVQEGGSVAPGNSIGILTVNGALTFATGATYLVEANNEGQADRIVAMGDVALDGTVRVEAMPDQATAWRPYNDYLILSHSGSRDGTFAGVETNLAFLTPTLDYGTGTVTLRLDRNEIDFAAVGQTDNQRAAGAALQALGLEHVAAAPGVPLYDEVLGMTRDDARAAFDAVSGEFHAGVRGMLLDDSRLLRQAVLGQLYQQEAGAGFWLRALGHQGQREGDGVTEFERDAVGLLAGAIYPLGDAGSSLGWAAGYHMNASMEAGERQSEGDANNVHVALYGSLRPAPGIGLRLGLGQTWHEVDARRTVHFPGYEEQLSSDYDGTTLQAFGEVDLRLDLGEGRVLAPFIGVAWARLDMDGFQEADYLTPVGSTAALEAAAQDSDASFATLGARGVMPWGERSQLQGMLGYRRTLSGDEPDLRVGFLDGAQDFDVTAAPIARDALVADLGLDWGVTDRIRLGAAYSGQLAADAQDHAIEARLRWTLE